MSGPTFDTSDLSFDELEEIRAIADKPVSQSSGELTPGECQMARDYAADGVSHDEIAELFPIDEGKLTIHIDGFCDCDQDRREEADGRGGSK